MSQLGKFNNSTPFPPSLIEEKGVKVPLFSREGFRESSIIILRHSLLSKCDENISNSKKFYPSGFVKLSLTLNLNHFVTLSLSKCDNSSSVTLSLSKCDENISNYKNFYPSGFDPSTELRTSLLRLTLNLIPIVTLSLSKCDNSSFVTLSLSKCDNSSFVTLSLSKCDENISNYKNFYPSVFDPSTELRTSLLRLTVNSKPFKIKSTIN